jgi:hypothetical protein
MRGLRPKRSDSMPCTGEATNCISAQAVPNRPMKSAPRTVSPPTKSTTSFGSTGMMIPIASMSSSTVMKMKMKAARRTGVIGGSSVMSYR